jgi:predicted ATPase
MGAEVIKVELAPGGDPMRTMYVFKDGRSSLFVQHNRGKQSLCLEGNVERAERVEQEIDALTRELSRTVGLGGRDRRAGSASERARQSIGKSIKTVLERIAQNDAALGDIFSRCIRTGTFCSYQPDPVSPIVWEFAATIAEQQVQPITGAETTPARADRSQASPPVLETSPFSLAERTAFVGRETEGSAIRAVIDHALTGDGSVVMLWDGPGVGKSRLAMEMASYASRVGFRCSVGHCYERDEPFPYLPFVEIIENNLARAPSLDDYRQRVGDTLAELAQIAPSLRRIFPDISKPLELPPAQQRRYLFQSFSEALARLARTRPQLLVLEDLHWADESTLALLIYVANRIAQLPVLIVGTYRSGYSDQNPELVRTLEELVRMGIRPQRLSGLSKDSVAKMLQGLSQREAPDSLVSLIFEESEGYPFFVEELYRHLIEEGKVFDTAGQFRTDTKIDEIDVPENVRLIISRRLRRLDENERHALAAAAVIGRSFSFQLLTAISQIDVDELFTVIEKAQRMGIIVPRAEGPEKPFTFAHELVRQTLIAEISIARRQQLHAKVAAALESLDPTLAREQAREISDHLVKAGSFADGRKLVRYLTIGGKRALDAAAFGEARQSFRFALSETNALEPQERAELLVSLAIAERGLDHWDTAVANLREALEICFKLGDRKTITWIVNELTDALFWVGLSQEAIATAQRGLNYFGAEISAERARLFATIGWAHAHKSARDYERAEESMRHALNIASQLSDPKLEAELLGVRSEINIEFSRLREAVEDGLRCEHLAGSDLPPWRRARHLFALHMALLHLGRVEEAIRVADQLEPLARKMGQSISLAFCAITRALLEFGKEPDLVKLDAAFQLAWEDQQSSITGAETLFETRRSLVDFFRGDWASAMSHAQAAYQAQAQRSFAGYGVGMLFRLMAYAGDRNGALALLDETRALLPHGGQKNETPSWVMLLLVIEGLVMLGEHSQAGQFYPLVRELIEVGAVELFRISHFSHTIAGLAAGAERQWEAAEDHFRIAMQQAKSLPDSLEQAEIRRFHAMMLIDRAAPGDREKAQTLLREALESYQRIGMPRHVDLTQTLLARVAEM